MDFLVAAVAAAFLLPGFSPSAAQPGRSELLTGVFPGTVRPGYVYLPPQFDPARRYPVVYLLHGLPGSPAEYIGGTSFGSFADDAISAGRVQPFIAIIPAAGQTASYNGEWAGDQWETALVHDVVPWVDASLPT